MRAQECKELPAVLALKALGPKDLFLALRDQVTRSLIDRFGWSGGEFEVNHAGSTSPGGPLPADRSARPRAGGNRHPLAADRTLTALGDRVGEYPRPAPLFVHARKSLLEDEALRTLLDSLDGSLTTWGALQRAGSPTAFAAFWVLDAIGALEYSPVASESGPDVCAEETQSGLEMDIDGGVG